MTTKTSLHTKSVVRARSSRNKLLYNNTGIDSHVSVEFLHHRRPPPRPADEHVQGLQTKAALPRHFHLVAHERVFVTVPGYRPVTCGRRGHVSVQQKKTWREKEDGGESPTSVKMRVSSSDVKELLSTHRSVSLPPTDGARRASPRRVSHGSDGNRKN